MNSHILSSMMLKSIQKIASVVALYQNRSTYFKLYWLAKGAYATHTRCHRQNLHYKVSCIKITFLKCLKISEKQHGDKMQWNNHDQYKPPFSVIHPLMSSDSFPAVKFDLKSKASFQIHLYNFSKKGLEFLLKSSKKSCMMKKHAI